MVDLDLGEIGAGGEIGRDGRRHWDFHVEASLAAKKSVPDSGADTVVFRRSGSRQDIRVRLDIADAIEGAELRQLAFIEQVIQPLGPAPRTPQVLFILASDEAAHVEPESQIVPLTEAQRAERDSELGGPAGRIARYDDVPDAVPVLVEIIDPDELGVPHRAVRIGAEDEGSAAVVKTVDQ